MTRPEAARLVRERWERLGIGTPEEFPRVFSGDVENMLKESDEARFALTTYHTSRGGNSDGLHVTQAASRESDRHSAISELDAAQKRNGCVAKTDMPRNDAVTADESSASAGSLDVADMATGNAPDTDSPSVGDPGAPTSCRVDAPGSHSPLDHFTDNITRYVDKKLGRETELAEVGQ